VKTNVDLRAVDLSAYPDLVVIYLGMRVRTFPGIKTRVCNQLFPGQGGQVRSKRTTGRNAR
jgi:hypothetical protein